MICPEVANECKSWSASDWPMLFPAKTWVRIFLCVPPHTLERS